MTTWHHSPAHRLSESGAYIVTASTYKKLMFFDSAEKLTYLCRLLFELAEQCRWELQAWAVFPNHYHFVALAPTSGLTFPAFLRKLHSISAIEVNRRDAVAGRKVWHQYWDTQLTFAGSYYARLNYVHQNAVHHGLVTEPTLYEWYSAAWFQRTADPAFRRQVTKSKFDQLKIEDDFDLSGSSVCAVASHRA